MLPAGSRLGPYEILAFVGAGGMGEVYRAHDIRLGRDVALKVLADGRLEDERSVARFEQEARLAGSLDHPNVVAVHDVGEHEGHPYFVTELLSGETLRARLKAGALSQTAALALALQVARGMAAAHDKGIVHRDLKPENVFLTHDAGVKILDFGIAKLSGTTRAGIVRDNAPGVHTRTGTSIGTPAYMSPEQIQGHPADERSDIFAFGAILYEMLGGRRAFDGDSDMELGAAILHDEPAPLPSAVPARLADLVAHCLEKDREHRFQSGHDLVFQLQAVADDLHLPGGVPKRRGTARVGRPAPIGSRATTIFVALALCIAAAIGIWTMLSRDRDRGGAKVASEGPSIAVLPFTDLSPQKDQEYFSDGLAEELQNALAQVDGLRVAGRASSFSFKGKNEDVRSVGRKLTVRHLLEGSVRKAGRRVRITAQLIGVEDGFDLWSQSYDRELTDVFDVQEDIARAVVQALRVKLLPGRAPAGDRHRTTNPEVYRLYLLGRQIADRFPAASSEEAIKALRSALAIDPGYAPAWAALANALFLYSEGSAGAAYNDARSEAMRTAEKAVALDGQLAEAYAARGNLRALFEWDWSGALQDLDRALSLQPQQIDVLVNRASILGSTGRMQEALVSAAKAVDLDPLSVAAAHRLIWLDMGNGDFSRARANAEKLLQVAPDNSFVLFDLAFVDLLDRRPADALARFAGRAEDEWAAVAAAIAHHDLGRTEEARAALHRVEARGGAPASVQIAWVYAWWGDAEKAFRYLDRAAQERDTGITDIKYDPFLKNLHADPRFAALLRRLNLPAD